MSKKKGKLDEKSIEMLKLRKNFGKGNKEIAEIFGVSEVTVSRRINAVEEELAELLGFDISDPSKAFDDSPNPNMKKEAEESRLANYKEAGDEFKVALRGSNPFEQISNFQDLGRISASGGAIPGMGLASLQEGFTNEDLSDDERIERVMKGASSIAATVFGTYISYKRLADQQKNMEG